MPGAVSEQIVVITGASTGIGRATALAFAAKRARVALADAMVSVRRLGVGTQRTDRPDNGVDDVDAPVDGPGQVHGSYPGRVLKHSLFTRLIGRRPRPGELVTAALARRRRSRDAARPTPEPAPTASRSAA